VTRKKKNAAYTIFGDFDNAADIAVDKYGLTIFVSRKADTLDTGADLPRLES